LGGFEEDALIHHGEGLQRRIGAFAAHAGVGGIGGIEGGERGIEHAAQGDDVEAATVDFITGAGLPLGGATDIEDIFRQRRTEAGAADGGFEQAADGKRGVAQDFGVEADAVLTGEEAVEGIGLIGLIGRIMRSLAIGLTHHDALDELFAAPAKAHELGGEVVEEFGMAGGFATGAEVIWRAHEAVAEEFAPKVIHGDAGGERVLRGNEPLGEFEAGVACLSGQGGKRGGHHIGAAAGVVAREVDVGLAAVFGDFGEERGFGFGVVAVLGVVEEGVEAVVIADGDGIVFVRVALRTADGEAHPHASGGVDAIDEVLVARFFFIDAGLGVQRGVTVKTGARRHIGKVSGDLGDGELVIRHVVIEGLDDPVTVAVGVGAEAVSEEAVRVGIAGHVEPVAAPALAKAGIGEELIDESGVFFASKVSAVRWRRQANEIEIEPADEGAGSSTWRGLEAVFLQFGANEAVDVVMRRMALDRLKGPMRLILRT